MNASGSSVGDIPYATTAACQRGVPASPKIDERPLQRLRTAAAHDRRRMRERPDLRCLRPRPENLLDDFDAAVPGGPIDVFFPYLLRPPQVLPAGAKVGRVGFAPPNQLCLA